LSPHEPPVDSFERATRNQPRQSDLFTFLLKRENRRVCLIAFLDDFSHFVVAGGVYASAGGTLVREVLDAAIEDAPFCSGASCTRTSGMGPITAVAASRSMMSSRGQGQLSGALGSAPRRAEM
jgi:hypothetical protein